MQNESVPQVQLVLVVIWPPSGVRFAVQSGRDGLLQPYSSSVNVYRLPSL
jgi:streptogramin lyase